MTVRKIVAGSVLAAGLGVAGVLGAGSAFAAPAPSGPGISFSSNGGDAVGFGGAVANSGKVGNYNNALAINTGLSPLGSSATANGIHNRSPANSGVTAISKRPDMMML